MTMGIMSCIALGLLCLILFRDKQGKENTFFNVDSTNLLRGFWSIVVLLIHVPQEYQNFLQNTMGSFAYIGVTFFFMASGYGLSLGVINKPTTATKGFWKRRLPKLLIPMLLMNLTTILVNAIIGNEVNFWQVIGITGFVRQLLLFYFIFNYLFL